MTELHFTSASLEDYRTCPRRFQLRFLLSQPWPAQVTAPEDAFENHLRQGAALHRLIQQDLLGMPRERLKDLARDEPLATWWEQYLEHAPRGLPAQKLPEIELSAHLEGCRLVGKFDLLAFEPGVRFVIVDWKTERKPPSRERLAARMQSILYPYLLVEGGSDYNDGEAIKPAQVEMIYWFAENPKTPQKFDYSDLAHAENQKFLSTLLEEILTCEEDDFPLTNEERSCLFCNYRSLCKRGKQAGEFDQIESVTEDFDPYFDLDFDQLDEVAF